MSQNTFPPRTRWLALGCAAALTGLFWLRPDPSADAAASKLMPAPELSGGPWLNTPDQKPISLASRRGKVTVVEFWTFGCSNCRANLPIYNAWNQKFAPKGVEIIGVHTPEFDSERKLENVQAQVKDLGIKYPVLLDNKSENWTRWSQKYWPAIYLVDKNGQIRTKWEGELGKDGAQKIGAQIEALIAEAAPMNTNAKEGKMSEKITKTDAEWRKELSPEAFDVLRNHGTERAFTGALLNEHEKGVFECGACGLPLFSSDAKFDSGTGWPSFFQAIKPGAVEEKTDRAYGMTRTEVVCPRCGSHLGHVFDDGPQPTGLRYCMNSVALKFEKK